MSNQSESLKVPPHDLELERSVLGSIMLDSSLLYTVADYLDPVYFYIPEHQIIYQGMLNLFEKQQPIDILTLKSVLQKDNNLKKIGGMAYLSNLVNTVSTTAYALHYAKLIKGHYIKRKLISLSSQTVEQAFDIGVDVNKLLDQVETEIYNLSQEHFSRDFVHLKNILAYSLKKIEELQVSSNKMRGIPTGFVDLDRMLSGLQESNLIILAARPGVGKTSFALNITLQVAVAHKIPVAFFSLEMSKEELVDRLLVSQADIDAWKLKTGRLDPQEHTDILDAMAQLSETPIYIDDTPGLSIMDMRAKARRLKTEVDIKLIVVDYLQLVDAGKKFDSRTNEVSYISQGLKNLARELKIPVLSLSQLSRAVEQRGGSKRPQLSDLRESGAIEQDADVVMFIYRENEDDDLLSGQNKMLVKLSVAKHRNGPTGEIDLMFRGDRVRFYSVEK